MTGPDNRGGDLIQHIDGCHTQVSGESAHGLCICTPRRDFTRPYAPVKGVPESRPAYMLAQSDSKTTDAARRLRASGKRWLADVVPWARASGHPSAPILRKNVINAAVVDDFLAALPAETPEVTE